MRRVLGLVVIFVAASASAHPHAQVTFAVAHGGEALGYFAPEVARTVAQTLEASAGEGELVVAGRLEDIGGERVRLSATLHGRSASVEGTVESIDASAAQLASRLLAFVGDAAPIKESAHAAKPADRKLAVAPPAHEKAPAAHPPEAQADPPREKAAPAEKFSDPTTTPATGVTAIPSATGAGATTPSSTVTVSSPSTSATTTAPASTAPSPSATAPSGVSSTVTTGPAPSTAAPVSTVSAVDPRATAPNPYPGYRYARNRVVVHTVPESPSAFVGSGTAATQALYAFLGRRLGLQVVPIGLGMTSPRVAADEGWRAGARAVVMARLESVDYQAAPTGATIRCRIEVVVVREGRVALRRVVESAPTPMPTGARGGRGLDPVFIAVSQSLEALAPDFNATLADLR